MAVNPAVVAKMSLIAQNTCTSSLTSSESFSKNLAGADILHSSLTKSVLGSGYTLNFIFYFIIYHT